MWAGNINFAAIIERLDGSAISAIIVFGFAFLCFRTTKLNRQKMAIFAIAGSFGGGLLVEGCVSTIFFTLSILILADCIIMEYIIPARHKRSGNKKRRAKSRK